MKTLEYFYLNSGQNEKVYMYKKPKNFHDIPILVEIELLELLVD